MLTYTLYHSQSRVYGPKPSHWSEGSIQASYSTGPRKERKKRKKEADDRCKRGRLAESRQQHQATTYYSTCTFERIINGPLEHPACLPYHSIPSHPIYSSLSTSRQPRNLVIGQRTTKKQASSLLDSFITLHMPRLLLSLLSSPPILSYLHYTTLQSSQRLSLSLFFFLSFSSLE